ncbi:MAG TPA: hypothetical protein VJ810_35660 [Blastocatellia bacterium]|nr:hypothetical protein [Blastocatellia bacterium]
MRMNIKMNSAMRTQYPELESSRITGTASLSSDLLRLIEPGFTEVEGAVLLKTQEKLAKGVKPGNFPDLTGYECFVNHVHIEDYLSEAGLGSNARLKQGIAFANKIMEELSSLFPSKLFKVIVATNESECNVRFHLIRSGENWLSDNLDKYGQEGILVLETSPV